MSEPAGRAASDGAGRSPAPAFLAEHGARILVALLIAHRLWYHVASIVSLEPEPVFMRLWFRLALAALGFWLFHRAVRGQFGVRAADLSLAVLLGYPALAFFENKELPVSVAVACSAVALWGMCRLLPMDVEVAELEPDVSGRVPVAALLLAGFGTGLSLLAVPYMLAGLPLCLGSLSILARSRRSPAAPWALVFALGLALACGVELLRELVIGQRPKALSTAGWLETLRALPAIEAWEPKALWRVIGNDLSHGDAGIPQIGLPFGALLALGYLGCAVLLRRAVRVRGERARRLALALALGGQIVGLLVWAAVSVSVATQVLLCMPLAFVAGPALLGLFGLFSSRSSARAPAWQVGWVSLLVGALLFIQAYWPRT